MKEIARAILYSRYIRRPTTYLLLVMLNVASVVEGQEIRNRNAVSSPRREAQVSPKLVPGNGLIGREHKLGIFGTNTDVGVVVQRVNPGSVAQQVGLEPRDVIVNVDGYQVGLVAGRLYDLGDELARRVNSQGEVMLLVVNHRNGQLTNIRVRFTNDLTIRGSVFNSDRRAFPPGATLMVRLIDVTNSGWREVVVQQVSLGSPGRWPVQYELQVNSSRVFPHHRYQIDARMIHFGSPISSSASVPISPITSSAGVDFTLQGVATQLPGSPAILPIDQIRQWYERFLGRAATEREIAMWQNELLHGGSLDEVEASILSSSEYFERSSRDKDWFVREVYRDVHGDAPSQAEHQRLRELLEKQQGMRLPLAQEVIQLRTVNRHQ